MGKNKESVQDTVDRFIPEHMLDRLYKAAKNGLWDGMDGVKSILDSDRMRALKIKGDKYHKEALLKCLDPDL